MGKGFFLAVKRLPIVASSGVRVDVPSSAEVVGMAGTVGAAVGCSYCGEVAPVV